MKRENPAPLRAAYYVRRYNVPDQPESALQDDGAI